MMDKPQKVTAILKVTAEFYDPEATPETVRYAVEQTLEDAGYEVVNVENMNGFVCDEPPTVIFQAKGEENHSADERDYKQDYIDFVNLVTDGKFDHAVPFGVAKSRYMGSFMQKLYLKNRRKDILQELVRYREGSIPDMEPEYVDALIAAIMESVCMQHGNWISVKDRLPESAGVATLVTAVNAHGQKCVFEAFLGYGDMYWYTLDTTKMQKHGSNRVDSCWTITHWTEMPEPPEDEA